MSAGDWNFMTGRLVGDGTVEITESDLPIDVSSIDDNLSAPSMMTGSITHALERLKNLGRPIFEPWNTVILAVSDDLLRGYTIYRKPDFNGPTWTLDQIGLTGYLQNLPYEGDVSYIGTDPLGIFRDIWTHAQSYPNSHLGVTVDDLTSPIRVGTPVQDVAFTTGAGEAVAFEAGPRKLNWWSTHNLAREVDNYASETPFDWAEQLYFDDDQPHCHIRLGYPQLGARKDHFRFVLGENLATEPSITTGDFANEAWVIGAGEGPDTVRGYKGIADGKLRRVSVVSDRSKGSRAEANELAARRLASSRGEYIVESLDVYEHPNAPLDAIELGDEIPLHAETSWMDLNDYARVVGRSQAPGRSDVMKLRVIRPAVT